MSRASVIIAALSSSIVATSASASFHLMQIEQVVGGVNGDAGLQAIQLRMRSSLPQNEIVPTRMRVFDASGGNPIVLVDFDDDVPNGGLGVRILIASEGFQSVMETPVEADFTMQNLIPESYLAAGSMTFEDDSGLILWRLSWGGDAYSGPNDGLTINDADGDFGPPWAGGLPTQSPQALDFLGGSSAMSSSNADDYAVTEGPSTWTNNAGDSTPLVDAVDIPGDVNHDGHVDVEDLSTVLLNWGCEPGPAMCEGDANDDGHVDVEDFSLVILNWD